MSPIVWHEQDHNAKTPTSWLRLMIEVIIFGAMLIAIVFVFDFTACLWGN